MIPVLMTHYQKGLLGNSELGLSCTGVMHRPKPNFGFGDLLQDLSDQSAIEGAGSNSRCYLTYNN